MLQKGVVGATYSGQRITWKEIPDGDPHVLTGATITGRLEDANGTARAIQGTLSVTDGANGVFTWDYHTNDLVAGTYKVQFKATFPGAEFDLTLIEEWTVVRAI